MREMKILPHNQQDGETPIHSSVMYQISRICWIYWIFVLFRANSNESNLENEWNSVDLLINVTGSRSPTHNHWQYLLWLFDWCFRRKMPFSSVGCSSRPKWFIPLITRRWRSETISLCSRLRAVRRWFGFVRIHHVIGCFSHWTNVLE